jgi:hypothetical protein
MKTFEITVTDPYSEVENVFVIIDKGNNEFISMLKSTYEAQQAEQSTPIVTNEAKTK